MKIHLAAIALCCLPTVAHAVDFEAAVGRQGFGRCHMDECSFFMIDAAVPVGSTKDGTLFALADRSWSAEYKPTDDDHEYDRPPKSVSTKLPGLSMVFCSKTKPVLFNFYEGKWHSLDLRPGDESAVFGYNESGYQYYYAACHHFITKDPVSKAMALKLGYRFAKAPAGGDAPTEGNRQPMDVLK